MQKDVFLRHMEIAHTSTQLQFLEEHHIWAKSPGIMLKSSIRTYRANCTKSWNFGHIDSVWLKYPETVKLSLSKGYNFRPLSAAICCISIDSSMTAELPCNESVHSYQTGVLSWLSEHLPCCTSQVLLHWSGTPFSTKILMQPWQQQACLAGQIFQLLHWQTTPHSRNYFMLLKSFYLIGCFVCSIV